MPLFKTPKRSEVAEKELIQKVKNVKEASTNFKLGKNSLLTSITNIKIAVDTKLGLYKDNYLLLQNESDITNYFDKIINNGICALDTETTGLNALTDNIVGLCLYTPNEKAVYIPINHISYIDQQLLPNQVSKEFISNQLKRLMNCKIIYHNAKFDFKMITSYFKIRLPIYYDTMLVARLLCQTEPANLKYQYAKYCEDSSEFSRFGDLFDNIPFQFVPLLSAYIYGAKDAEMTYKLYEYQSSILEKQPRVKWVAYNIEFPCIEPIAQTELNGVEIDFEYANSLKEKYTELEKEAELKCYEEIDKYKIEIESYKKTHYNHKLSDPINLSSPSQLATLFYDILKYPSVDKKQPRGTGVEILEKWNKPICTALLKYREYIKLMSTYIEAIPSQAQSDGRIHCNFNQYGADTGRLSSSEPNLQNIPSHNTDIRKMFKAKEGYVLVGSDFSQQEPRLLSFLSQDENLIKAYKDGLDVYAFIASVAFHKPYDECKEFFPDGSVNKEGKKRRTQIKSIVLGIMYSKQPASIATDLGISKEEADNVFNAFFKAFPKVKTFITDTQNKVAKIGYTETVFGRRRYLDDMLLPIYEITRNIAKPKNFDPTDFNSSEELDYTINDEEIKYWQKRMNKAFGFSAKKEVIDEASREGINIKDNSLKKMDAERQCVNSVIQGSASDMTKLAIIDIYNNKELQDLGFKLEIYVHDEIIGECPIENAKRCGELLGRIMSNCVKDYINVPFKCDAEITKNWYGESIKL